MSKAGVPVQLGPMHYGTRNGHMETPHNPPNRLARLKTLPSNDFDGG